MKIFANKKNILLWLLFVFCGYFSCFSQQNTIISTDPRNNSQGQPIANNPGRPEAVNRFNWMNSGLHFYHFPSFVDLNHVYDNPFFTDNLELSSINFHIRPFGSLDRNESVCDFHPEDGWELIHKNNGFKLDEATLMDQSWDSYRRKAPYIVLYNKYSGLLRVLSAWDESFVGSSFLQTEMKLWLPSNAPTNLYGYSGILSNNDSIVRPLDQSTRINRITATSAPVAEGSFWCTDFFVTYDPCVKFYRSGLEFNFQSFTQADLTLSGRLLGTSVPLDGSGNSPLLNGNGRDFLQSVYKDEYNMANTGMLIWNKQQALVEKYRSPQRSWLEDLGITAVGALLNGAGGYLDKVFNSALTPVATKLVTQLGINEKINVGLNIFAQSAKSINASLFPENKIPNIGFIEAEMAITGTYQSEVPIPGAGFTIAMPGSAGTNDPSVTPIQKYPAYNEALGVFTLLKTPLLKIARATSDWVFDMEWAPGRWSPCYRCEYILQLDENSLLYAFNPASEVDLDKTKILASLWVVDNHDKSYTDERGDNMCSTMTRQYLVEDNNPYVSRYYYSTSFIPLSCIGKMSFTRYYDTRMYEMLKGGFLNCEKPLIKLLVHFVSKPNKYGKVVRRLMEFTYPLDVVEPFQRLDNLYKDEFLAYNPYNSTMTMTLDTTFSQTNFTVSKSYSYWNNVVINGNLSTAPGVNVTITAANEITIQPGVEISPNIHLKVDVPTECTPLSPVSDEYINQFCTCNEYKANAYDNTKKYAVQLAERQKANKESNELFIETFPNPVLDRASIHINLTEEALTSVTITNVLGQIVYKPIDNMILPKGERTIYQEFLNTEKGVYFINLITPSKQVTQKIVVIK